MDPVTRPLGQLPSSLFMKKSDNFGLAAHARPFGAGAHVRSARQKVTACKEATSEICLHSA